MEVLTIKAAVRNKIIKRDKFCQRCGISRCLEVHHITLKTDGGQDTDDNLIALCYFCHKEWHYMEEFNLNNTALIILFAEWLKDIPPIWTLFLTWRQEWPGDMTAKEFKHQLYNFWIAIRELNLNK
jgi:hypothetical protein